MANDELEQEGEYGRQLRNARAVQNEDVDEEEQMAMESSSQKENWNKALTLMTVFDVAGDLLGAIPFLGGIVRLITGVGAVIQSFKLSPAIRVRAWIINGIMSVIEIILSFVGLNILPTQTIGAFIIRRMANNVGEEETEQLE